MGRNRSFFGRIRKFFQRFTCTAVQDEIEDFPDADFIDTKIEDISITQPDSPDILSFQSQCFTCTDVLDKIEDFPAEDFNNTQIEEISITQPDSPDILSFQRSMTPLYPENHIIMTLPGAVPETPETLSATHLSKFYQLLEVDIIQKLLDIDKNGLIADKYLLAITAMYFKRAGLKSFEFTPLNFFVALYLAHDIEEDIDLPKTLIILIAFGERWKENVNPFLSLRDELLMKMDYRARVTKAACEEVMLQHISHHWVWSRTRNYDNTDNVTMAYFLP